MLVLHKFLFINYRLKEQIENLRTEMDELKETHLKQESRTLEELQAARQAIRDQNIRIANQENNFKQLNNMRKELEHKLETYLLKVTLFIRSLP